VVVTDDYRGKGIGHIVPLSGATLIQKRSGIARIVKGSHSFYPDVVLCSGQLMTPT